jgi:hypothetical protein
MLGDQRAGKEGIVLGFLSPQRVEPNLLRSFGDRGDVFQTSWRKYCIEFHFTTTDTKDHEAERKAFVSLRALCG